MSVRHFRLPVVQQTGSHFERQVATQNILFARLAGECIPSPQFSTRVAYVCTTCCASRLHVDAHVVNGSELLSNGLSLRCTRQSESWSRRLRTPRPQWLIFNRYTGAPSRAARSSRRCCRRIGPGLRRGIRSCLSHAHRLRRACGRRRANPHR